MKDTQLVGLRTSDSYGCMLRNTVVEVHHVYVFYFWLQELHILPNNYPGEEQTFET